MKNEFIELKNSVNDYIQEKEIFEYNRVSFNDGVDILKGKLGITEVINTGKDCYENAKVFEQYFPILKSIDNKIKEKYPNYNLIQRKEKVYGIFEEEVKELDSDYAYNYIINIIENYYLYDACFFGVVKQTEIDTQVFGQKVHEASNELLKQQKQAIQHAGKFAVNVVKPYSEVAKEQLLEVKGATKKMVNRGSKKLVKVFQNIADRTNS